MVMAGQEEEEEETAGVGKLSTGAGADSGPDLEPTVEHDTVSEPELKPVWTFCGKGLVRSDSND